MLQWQNILPCSIWAHGTRSLYNSGLLYFAIKTGRYNFCGKSSTNIIKHSTAYNIICTYLILVLLLFIFTGLILIMESRMPSHFLWTVSIYIFFLLEHKSSNWMELEFGKIQSFTCNDLISFWDIYSSSSYPLNVKNESQLVKWSWME